MTNDVQAVPVSGTIRLGQFLKLAGLVEDGAWAKVLLADEAVSVNGAPETRRGRQLRPGDLVSVDLPDGAAHLQVQAAP